MAFVKKTWKDRVAEYINRRVLTKEDGTTELVTVERSEGTISQEGDAFSAANMNDLEQRIADEFSEQNKNISKKIEIHKLEKPITFSAGMANLELDSNSYVVLSVEAEAIPCTLFIKTNNWCCYCSSNAQYAGTRDAKIWYIDKN